MAFQDAIKNVWAKLNEVPFSGRGQQTNLANGGHTGYVPVQAPAVQKKPSRLGALIQRYLGDGEQPAPAEQAAQGSQAYDPSMAQFSQSYDPNYVQQGGAQPAYPPQPQQAEGGFGGQQGFFGGQMSYTTGSQQAQFGTGAQQAQFGTGAQQAQFGTGAQQPQFGTGSQQPQYGQQLQPPIQPPVQESRFGSRPFGAQSAQEQSAFGARGAAQEPNFGPLVPDSGKTFQGADGAYYRHVEELATITRLADCYHLMEYMLDTRTVIVSMDMVQDSRERQRCADLLFGAAYSLGCSLSRISMTNTYLISPRAVLVHASRSMDMLNQRDAATLWPGSGINERPGYAREEGKAPSQRRYA